METKIACTEERCWVCGEVLRLELPDKRKRGSPKKRLMDVVREDVQVAGVNPFLLAKYVSIQRICGGGSFRKHYKNI